MKGGGGVTERREVREEVTRSDQEKKWRMGERRTGKRREKGWKRGKSDRERKQERAAGNKTRINKNRKEK